MAVPRGLSPGARFRSATCGRNAGTVWRLEREPERRPFVVCGGPFVGEGRLVIRSNDPLARLRACTPIGFPSPPECHRPLRCLESAYARIAKAVHALFKNSRRHLAACRPARPCSRHARSVTQSSTCCQARGAYANDAGRTVATEITFYSKATTKRR